MKVLRVYADTSVFGGCFDPEFDRASLAFFEEVRSGRFVLLVSDVTLRELAAAPDHVQKLVPGLPNDAIEIISDSAEVRQLRDAYLAANVVGPASHRDAEHIAAATLGDADVVVSWNFKHIVHFDRIRGYEAVNLLQGYKPLRIHSPNEVIES